MSPPVTDLAPADARAAGPHPDVPHWVSLHHSGCGHRETPSSEKVLEIHKDNFVEIFYVILFTLLWKSLF